MKTAVLLSGGVDSSVALTLLARAGRPLTAFYLKIWLEDEVSYLGSCPWEEDLSFARAVCEKAGVELRVLPLQREYHERVVQYAVEELRRGATPSPDLFCNRLVKFGAFLERSGESWERVVTGHYARLERHAAGVGLYRSPDPVKDQTYFLSRMDGAQLARAEFPLGPYTKVQVRRLAAEWDLPTKDRPDSQGICFLGKIPYRRFVEHYLGRHPGPMVDIATGRVLGRHQGLWFYTLGQRSGLGLSNGPWYVCGKDLRENVLWLSHADRKAQAERTVMLVDDLHWIGSPPPEGEYQVKVRHGPRLYRARLRYRSPIRTGPDSTAEVHLAEPDLGLAPGQFCVFYRGEECLGSGRIGTLPEG